MSTRGRLITVLAIALAAFFIGIAVSKATSQDQWTTERTNDVKIPQNVILDFLTPNDNKDFKFSFSRPIEIFPGFWCVFFNTDMHTEKYGPDNFPYQHCFDRKEIADQPDRMAYVRKWQLSLEYDASCIGTGKHPKHWPGSKC